MIKSLRNNKLGYASQANTRQLVYIILDTQSPKRFHLIIGVLLKKLNTSNKLYIFLSTVT